MKIPFFTNIPKRICYLSALYFAEKRLKGEVTPHILGIIGEKLARFYLSSMGMRVLEKNFRCNFGEADLILMDKGCLVLCEVKTRAQGRYGEPEDAISPERIKRLIKTLEFYAKIKKLKGMNMRIDAISIRVNKKVEIRHFKSITK